MIIWSHELTPNTPYFWHLMSYLNFNHAKSYPLFVGDNSCQDKSKYAFDFFFVSPYSSKVLRKQIDLMHLGSLLWKSIFLGNDKKFEQKTGIVLDTKCSYWKTFLIHCISNDILNPCIFLNWVNTLHMYRTDWKVLLNLKYVQIFLQYINNHNVSI